MAISAISTNARNAMADGIAGEIDAGTGAGLFEIWTTGFGVLLGTLTHSDPAYLAATSGTATADTIADDASADATGTANRLRVTTSLPATVYEGTVTATGGGGDLELNTISITSGDTLSISSATLTAPAS